MTKLRTLLFLFVAALFPLLVGCGDRPDGPADRVGGTASEAASAPDLSTLTFAPALDIDISSMERTESGLYYRDDVVGEGEELQPGQAAVLHYTGYHPDGRSFDSSRQGGTPFRIQIGVGQVIRGWDDGVPGMREGGHRTLVIPPHLAYGEAGAGGGVIPPNAVLVFEVELLEVH